MGIENKRFACNHASIQEVIRYLNGDFKYVFELINLDSSKYVRDG